VGVAEYTFHYGLDQTHGDALYVPMELLPFPITRATVAVRAAGADMGLADAVREAIWRVEPGLPVPSFASLQSWVAESSGPRRFGSVLSSVFGILALLLAAGGLYGTLLYAVGQRRRELGIRLALGAGRGRIQTEVVSRGLVLATAGVVLGAFVAWFIGRLLESWLYGVSGQDPITLVAAATVLLSTAVLASWLPAHRAGRVDPLETLKAD
jgi:ABC-type antimicrobial peptide transport system permease subunit